MPSIRGPTTKEGNTTRGPATRAKPTKMTLNKTCSSTLYLETEAGKVLTKEEATVVVEKVRTLENHEDLPLRHDEDDLVEELQLRTST